MSSSGDHLDLHGAGIVGRLAPKATRGKTTSAGAIELGRVEEHVRAGLGPCDGIQSPPSFTQSAPPNGPNPPKFPPDHCTQNGCQAQPFPPNIGPPGGKQPVPSSLGVNAPVPSAATPSTTVQRTVDNVLRMLPVAVPPAAVPQPSSVPSRG